MKFESPSSVHKFGKAQRKETNTAVGKYRSQKGEKA
jgi:hypothetical protein